VIVVDASVVVHVLAVEEPGGPVHARLAGEEELHAPHLVDLDVTSALRGLPHRPRRHPADALPHHFLLPRVSAYGNPSRELVVACLDHDVVVARAACSPRQLVDGAEVMLRPSHQTGRVRMAEADAIRRA
jgi:hypothetical protein